MPSTDRTSIVDLSDLLATSQPLAQLQQNGTFVHEPAVHPPAAHLEGCDDGVELAPGDEVWRSERALNVANRVDQHLPAVQPPQELLRTLQRLQIRMVALLRQFDRELEPVAELLHRNPDVVQAVGQIDRSSGGSGPLEPNGPTDDPGVDGPLQRADLRSVF